ncbi:putative peptidyl-prolyl cis-trans isomerase YacD [Capsulimonas corticalis]|uniref:Peptidyl-prolyl cis-trans isomerase YacD n=1 Tax=Capsulimonas corticalis TaxID=2219043 RepID=A0A402CTW2_9BACT|nr:peptidyl-prolyl cis-trans isomerase [Capsulimonas corticalis]BDI28794.1 putative peptidyl-prolyl cis-trans isomerase YacD [Capsulimonas corticalis]
MIKAKFAAILGLAMLAVLPLAARADDSATPLITVGGETISRSDYLQILEDQYGKGVLQKLVFGSLIRQAAAKAGVTPTDADVDKRLAEVLRREPQIVPDAQRAPEQRKQFVANLKLDLSLENLRLRNISLTDDEAQQYYTAHSAEYELPQQAKTTIVVTDSTEDSLIAENLLKTGVSESAIAQKPGLHVVGVDGFNVNMDALSPADRTRISDLVLLAKPKEVKTVKVQNHFLTIRVISKDAKRIPPLAEIKSDVVRAAKLAKAPSAAAMIRTLYLQNPPTFQDQKYESDFDDVNPAVAH